MRPATVALAHLQRRSAKAVLLVLGLAIGAATVSTLLTVSWTMEAVLGDALRSTGVTARVTPERRQWAFSYAGLSVGSAAYQAQDLPAGTLERLAGVPGSVLVAPKLLELTSGPDGASVLAVGVAWDAEVKLRPYWRVSGFYPRTGAEVLLGSHLARLWDARVAGRVRLFGRAYRVAGILEETGQEEDGLVFMSLPELQERAGRPGAVTFAEVRTSAGLEGQDRWREELGRALPGTEVTLVLSVEQARLGLLDRIRAFTPLAAVVAVAAGALLVAASQLSSVRERTREVGLLRAVGYRTGHVMQVFLTEVVVGGTAAGILGYSGGVATAKLLLPLLDPATPASAVGWYPGLGAAIWAGSVGLSLLAAYVPARQGALADPAEALRFL